MHSAIMHKTTDILVKRGFNHWSAVSMTVEHFDEVLRLYPSFARSPAKIAEKIALASSL